ncbi:unnamed protein product [Gordionus sp. m RMFG-2023]
MLNFAEEELRKNCPTVCSKCVLITLDKTENDLIQCVNTCYKTSGLSIKEACIRPLAPNVKDGNYPNQPIPDLDS